MSRSPLAVALLDRADDDAPDAAPPRPTKERIRLRSIRFADLVRGLHDKMARDWRRPKELERFALLAEHPSGKLWLSTHETPDDAAASLEDDDSGFAPLELYDLEHPETRYEPVTTTTFRMIQS